MSNTATTTKTQADPCKDMEAHLAQLDFYGECAWCGAVEA